jgi:hypothetical protein
MEMETGQVLKECNTGEYTKMIGVFSRRTVEEMQDFERSGLLKTKDSIEDRVREILSWNAVINPLK